MDDVVDLREAARLLGVNEATVEVLIAGGEISVANPRRKRNRRIAVVELEAYMERSRVKPGELRHLYPPLDPHGRKEGHRRLRVIRSDSK